MLRNVLILPSRLCAQRFISPIFIKQHQYLNIFLQQSYYCRNVPKPLVELAESPDQIKLDEKPRKYIEFTCKVCGFRSKKTFSTKSYDSGIVIIRCEGCQKLHLIADNLGWLQKKGWKIEDLLPDKTEA